MQEASRSNPKSWKWKCSLYWTRRSPAQNIQCVSLAGSPGKCLFTKRTKVQYICMS
jgi:hypothetical protein